MRQIQALIPSSPLGLPEQLIHKDLAVWAKDLYVDLTSLSPRLQYEPLEACPSLNQAALIAAFKGDFEVANNLCHIQIRWLLQRTDLKDTTPMNIITLLQPWINIGRLHFLKKDYDQARSYMNTIEKIQHGIALDIGHIQLDHKLLEEILSNEGKDGELSRFLWINYINESLKIDLKLQNYQKALAFIREQRENCPLDFRDLLKEGEVIAWEHLGNYDLAIEKIKTHKPKDSYGKLVFLYHLTLIHYLDNSHMNAEKYCKRLAKYLIKGFKESEFILLKKLTLHTGKLCLAMGLLNGARDLFLRGYVLSEHLHDQRYAILFANGLIEANVHNEKAKNKWEKMIINHLEISDYRSPNKKYAEIGKIDRQSTINFEKLNTYIQQHFIA